MKSKNAFLFTVLFSTNLYASATEEVARYLKCHAIFTSERVPAGDRVLASIKAGSKDATSACMELLDKGSLNQDNELPRQADGNYDATGMKVLKTMTDFHRSFFSVPDYSLGLEYNLQATMDVIDANESAYHLSYVLFKKENYDTIVTRRQSLRARRFSRKGARTRRVAFSNEGLGFIQSFTATPTPWQPDYVTETGLLVGIEPDQRINRAPLFRAADGFFEGSMEPYAQENINQHMGAGILGTQSYLLGNSGPQSFLVRADGGLKTWRRWSKAIMNDLLCRDLPVLRPADVFQDVVPSSSLSYRKASSCMQCHSTMDPMAGAIRNVIRGQTGFLPGTVQFNMLLDTDNSRLEHPSLAGSASYASSLPEAQLKYRSYDGRLINHSVGNLQELGEKIASENDLYACAAKRYYKFFTGINVDLTDLEASANAKLGPGEKLYRDRIIQWGLDLKKDQNVRELIRKIIGSASFVYPDRGV